MATVSLADTPVRYQQVGPTVPVHIGHCHGLGGVSARVVADRRLECSIAIARKDADAAAGGADISSVLVSHYNIRFAVAVQICNG